MVENLGDAFETVEEMYGMIWWLADRLAAAEQTDAAAFVQDAADNHQHGLEQSPGTAGTLPVEE